MANTTKKKPAVKTKKLTPEEQAEQELEKYWEEVDQLAQQKIYQLLTNTLPFYNTSLITESYTYEDKQTSKTGCFLGRDANYRTLCTDIESQYSEEEELPSQEYLAEEITLNYCHILIKNIIAKVSEYFCYCPSYFENLTED